jgi:predicted DNA-binding transcriptional regulator AlpA
MATPRERALLEASGFDSLPDSGLVSVGVVAVLTGQSVSTVWRRTKIETSYPKPVRLSRGATRFRVGELRQFLAA